MSWAAKLAILNPNWVEPVVHGLGAVEVVERDKGGEMSLQLEVPAGWSAQPLRLENERRYLVLKRGLNADGYVVAYKPDAPSYALVAECKAKLTLGNLKDAIEQLEWGAIRLELLLRYWQEEGYILSFVVATTNDQATPAYRTNPRANAAPTGGLNPAEKEVHRAIQEGCVRLRDGRRIPLRILENNTSHPLFVSPPAPAPTPPPAGP